MYIFLFYSINLKSVLNSKEYCKLKISKIETKNFF